MFNYVQERHDASSPRFYVRQISESSPSDATTVTDHQSFNCGPLAFETPRSPDRHSRVSYDEDYSISDFEDHTLPSSPREKMFTETTGDASSPLCIHTPIVVGNDRRHAEGVAEKTINHPEIDSCIVSEEIDEQSPDSYEIVPRQVSEGISRQTPETFEMHHQQVSDGHGVLSSYFVEVDPCQVLDEIGDQAPHSYENECCQVSLENSETNLNDEHIDPDHIPDATWEQIDEHLESYCKEVQCIESEMSETVQINSMLPIGESSLLMGNDYENYKYKGDEPKQKTVLSDTNASSIQHAEEPSGKQQIIDMPERKNLNHVESRSCQSNDRSGRSSTSLEVVKFEMTPESGDGGYGFTVTVEETQMLSAQGHDVDNEASQTSKADGELDEASMTNIKISNHINYAENSIYDVKRKDIAEPQCTKQLANFQVIVILIHCVNL